LEADISTALSLILLGYINFIPSYISGIGIDDMFVIVKCLDNLTEEQVSSLSIPERIGVAMKHAGVAITVTSLTNVCAFGVGAVTVGL
jgi:Niemann-Pick C1 protein